MRALVDISLTSSRRPALCGPNRLPRTLGEPRRVVEQQLSRADLQEQRNRVSEIPQVDDEDRKEEAEANGTTSETSGTPMQLVMRCALATISVIVSRP